MIIQALVKRYEDTGGGLPGWQNRFADYAIDIDAHGNVLNITPLEQQGGKGEYDALLCCGEPPGRTSGIRRVPVRQRRVFFWNRSKARTQNLKIGRFAQLSPKRIKRCIRCDKAFFQKRYT